VPAPARAERLWAGIAAPAGCSSALAPSRALGLLHRAEKETACRAGARGGRRPPSRRGVWRRILKGC
jgi:hypothetical protein